MTFLRRDIRKFAKHHPQLTRQYKTFWMKKKPQITQKALVTGANFISLTLEKSKFFLSEANWKSHPSECFRFGHFQNGAKYCKRQILLRM